MLPPESLIGVWGWQLDHMSPVPPAGTVVTLMCVVNLPLSPGQELLWSSTGPCWGLLAGFVLAGAILEGPLWSGVRWMRWLFRRMQKWGLWY